MSDNKLPSGLKVIYAPRGQAGEYAPLSTNPYRGCSTGCAYCYVPHIPGQPDRKTFDAAAVPRAEYLAKLRTDAIKCQAAGVTDQIMLSFTSDVYNPSNTALTRPALQILRDHDLAFCVLTKGGTRALVDIDLFRPEHDAFAATLTALDDRFSQKWERNAALPGDRIAALRTAHDDRGLFTWVSLEPTLDVDASIEIVKATHRFVDLFKVGRVNYLKMTKTTDWESYTLRILDVLVALGKNFYIKRDLQKYLPPGINNILRQPQHH